jgi:hypothetical protein
MNNPNLTLAQRNLIIQINNQRSNGGGYRDAEQGEEEINTETREVIKTEAAEGLTIEEV